MSNITHEALMSAIAEVAAAERITKAGLASLSRDILDYMLDTQDIRPVNALLGKHEGSESFVLTPVNWRIACQYFHAFLPFHSNWKDVKDNIQKGDGKREPLVFAKKNKALWDKRAQEIAEFLENEGSNIWTWSSNIEMKSKPVDYGQRLVKALQACMDEEKGAMSKEQVLSIILNDGEFDADSIMAVLTAPEAQEAA